MKRIDWKRRCEALAKEHDRCMVWMSAYAGVCGLLGYVFGKVLS